jgi:pyrroline-5-carboxylate reductase
MKMSVGFIGGGRVTKILLQGFKNKGVKFDEVFVTDTNPDVMVKLKEKFPEIEQSDPKNAAKQDIVFIALHPPV